ncbi:MAG: hypothetical protein COA91_11155 [Robiginitomaculum sp.]|nr:MAG: hypothetical protein COA91_11155 [Robiginitomaculum sp.]
MLFVIMNILQTCTVLSRRRKARQDHEEIKLMPKETKERGLSSTDTRQDRTLVSDTQKQDLAGELLLA